MLGASELTASAKALGPISGEGAPSAEHLTPLQNRTSEGTSPFVKSFVDSPVAWQPLDNASIERARREHKLIFMHIGYLACHHCRLMAQESFANPDCAALLNEYFIPIVIDRDERPDLDSIYMNYVQAVSSSGGWPLNLFLTANLEPVFGGTYWPGSGSATTRGDTVRDRDDEVLDFVSVIKKVQQIWRDQEARCQKEATEVVAQLRDFAAEGTLGTRSLGGSHAIAPQTTSNASAAVFHIGRKEGIVASELDIDQVEEAYTHIAGTFDPVYAGFGLAPKFHTPPKLAFLLRLPGLATPVQDVVGYPDSQQARNMALDTLRQIASSALRDHVGRTGFARCSVTPDWSIPNFEKLVVDNSLLLTLYLEAWLYVSGKEDGEFFNTVLELADYLTSPPIALPNGGVASSEAADSYQKRGDKDMQEGAYYLWTRREFDSAINADKQVCEVAAAYYNVLEDGNVDEHHDPNDNFINRNILRIRRTPEDLGKQFNLPVETVAEFIKTATSALKEKRDKERIRPEVDDKVVTGFNGLAISSLARTGGALKSVRPDLAERYLGVAKKTAAFIKEQLWDGRVLYRIWKDRRSTTEAFADDYAYVIFGLVDLFDATGDESLLEFADVLQKTQISLFYDPIGAFYYTTPSSPHTIIRLKDGMDTSLPSTNSVSVTNLFRLGDLLADDKYTALARETVGAFEAEILQHPWLFPGLLLGVVTARLGVEKSGHEVKYKDTRTKAA
ncbi:unnamed protein product [Clonostachys solani]|uniref:Spermatogenesis-associated protein 20-like TRX domain-containing protein n=1 Tax=Clonostachys solani TaxID=160281 RepID=A0A9N9YW91_9HYPO|nr:unnamed protein product [Clonostachys solani]